MPGRCKFQEAWLAKECYAEWLAKDTKDQHSARCKACCKSIKIASMGEAALTSHVSGALHKKALQKLKAGRTFLYLMT